MIIKRFLLIISVLASSASQAQIVIKDWDKQLDDSEFRLMCRSARQVITSKNTDYRQISRADIFPLEQSWYLTMEGMFDVYKWQNQEWVNLYKPKFWGYNFASLKFVNNGNLYSFGGNGFWKVHGEVIKFYPHVNEWDILHTSAKLPFGLGLPGYNELFILREDSLSIFDLKSEKASSVYIPYNDSIPYFANKKVLESKNYTLSVVFNQILLDKRNKSIHYLARGAFIFIHGRHDGYFHVIGDSVTVYNNMLEFEMAELISADFERYRQLYPVVRTASSETDSGANYLLILSVFIMLGIGGYVYFFRAKSKVPGSEDLSQLVDQVTQMKGNTLSSDELDQSLNIPEYLSPENARYKRSKLVNEINDYYRIRFNTELITRIKDPTDKRKFFYRINP
jgi:hypothetical protein